jgi:hypothetical protein
MNNNYYLAIQDGKYNLGTCPNLLVDKYLHNLRLKEVKKELVKKCQDRKRRKEIWVDVMYDISLFSKSFGNVKNFISWINTETNEIWFDEFDSILEENPDAFGSLDDIYYTHTFYRDLVYGF